MPARIPRRLPRRKLQGDQRGVTRAQKLAKRDLPAHDPKAMHFSSSNGAGPRKYATGPIRRATALPRRASLVRSATLTVGEQTIHFTPWDNVNFQRSRGRPDHGPHPGQQSGFQTRRDTVGNVALVAPHAACRQHLQRQGATAPPLRPERRLKKKSRQGREKLRRRKRRHCARHRGSSQQSGGRGHDAAGHTRMWTTFRSISALLRCICRLRPPGC